MDGGTAWEFGKKGEGRKKRGKQPKTGDAKTTGGGDAGESDKGSACPRPAVWGYTTNTTINQSIYHIYLSIYLSIGNNLRFETAFFCRSSTSPATHSFAPRIPSHPVPSHPSRPIPSHPVGQIGRWCTEDAGAAAIILRTWLIAAL